MTCYIYAYRDFWKMRGCSWHSVYHIAKVSMDADLDAIAHGWASGIGGGHRNNLSECLEQPASDNGVDMYKYNTSYICKLNWRVLTPESDKVKSMCMEYLYTCFCYLYVTFEENPYNLQAL